MLTAPVTSKLMTQVARRLRWQSFVQTAFWSLVGVTLVYALGLLVRRLTGVVPDLFNLSSFAAVPLTAGLLALLLHRRPLPRDVARRVDSTTGSKDLFLTMDLLESSAGEYQPLVIQAAEDRAGRLQPQLIAPWGWQNRYWHAVWLPAVVAIGLLTLPQLDPFGRVAAAALVTQRKDRLDQSRRETQLRLAEVKQQQEQQDDTTPTDEAIEDLKLAFGQMQPQEKQENLKTLMSEQKEMGELWRKLANDKLKNLLKAAEQADQQFGGEELEKLKKWAEDLKEGNVDGMKEALKDIQEQLAQLSKTEDPIEKKELQKKLKEELHSMQKFAKENLDNKAIEAALQRIEKQLDLAQLGDLAKEALEAAEESTELAQAELEELSQSAEDLKQLEDALKAIQAAKRLNDKGKLDGGQCKNCKSMSDYEALYKKLMAGMQDGEVSEKEGKFGNAGPGRGKGGEAPEDDSVKSDWQSEVSKSAVTAGKVILSMKDKGLGEKGTATQDYKQLIQRVKQGVSEAIQQEQIPPGYHDGIKSYFDALDPADARK